jgi:hypothetical protein
MVNVMDNPPDGLFDQLSDLELMQQLVMCSQDARPFAAIYRFDVENELRRRGWLAPEMLIRRLIN